MFHSPSINQKKKKNTEKALRKGKNPSGIEGNPLRIPSLSLSLLASASPWFTRQEIVSSSANSIINILWWLRELYSRWESKLITLFNFCSTKGMKQKEKRNKRQRMHKRHAKKIFTVVLKESLLLILNAFSAFILFFFYLFLVVS